MVLWEITLGTAYFLGLKRTYKLALKIQRRLISPRHPKIRQFVHRRTRVVFDVAVKVHRNIQKRDIEIGRNFGNWILRCLDRMKPSAEIRGSLPPSSKTNITKDSSSSSYLNNHRSPQKFVERNGNQESGRHLFSASKTLSLKPFPSISMMMRLPLPAAGSIQHRRFSSGVANHFEVNHRRFGFGDVIRSDIKQWIMHH